SQGMASNEYQNAYNRFTNDQTNSFNRLASLAQLGQTSNGQMGQVGMNTANQIGSNMTGAANAAAASSIAQGNIWGGSLSGLTSGIGNNWVQYQQQQNYQNMMNYMMMQPGTINPNAAPASQSQWQEGFTPLAN